MQNSLVSLIIITYNSANYIKNLLNSLKKINYKNLEIIIIDNNSSDNTLALIKNKKLKNLKLLKSKKNLGYALANNLAAQKAQGKYLCFLNPDVFVDKDFLKYLVKKIEGDKNIAAVQPAVYLFNKKDLNLTGKEAHFLGLDWIKDFKTKKLPNSGQIYSLSGCGFLIKKNIFKKLKGFDSKYFIYYEDSDLSWKINLINKKICFENKAKIYHDYKFESQKQKQKLFFLERNRLINFFKNYNLKTILLFLPALVFWELGILIYAFLDNWGLIKLKSYLSLLKLSKYIIKQRKLIKKIRVNSDKKIIKNFSYQINFIYLLNPVVKYIYNPFFNFYFKLTKNLI